MLISIKVAIDWVVGYMSCGYSYRIKQKTPVELTGVFFCLADARNFLWLMLLAEPCLALL